jgi:hypothetical protein
MAEKFNVQGLSQVLPGDNIPSMGMGMHVVLAQHCTRNHTPKVICREKEKTRHKQRRPEQHKTASNTSHHHSKKHRPPARNLLRDLQHFSAVRRQTCHQNMEQCPTGSDIPLALTCGAAIERWYLEIRCLAWSLVELALYDRSGTSSETRRLRRAVGVGM